MHYTLNVRQGSILSQNLFNLSTESAIREAEIHELGIKTGGKLVYNLAKMRR